MPPLVVLVVLMTALGSPRVLATKKVKVFERRDANPYKEDNVQARKYGSEDQGCLGKRFFKRIFGGLKRSTQSKHFMSPSCDHS